MQEADDFLTAAEACSLLGVKPATLYAYVSRGRLRAYKQGVGRTRLYRRSEIRRLLQIEADERSDELGVIASAITAITPETVRYRGYDVAELAERARFSEVVVLLWDGERPDAAQCAALEAALQLPPPVDRAVMAIATAPEADPLVRLRLGLEQLGLAAGRERSPARALAPGLLAALPDLLAALRGGSAPPPGSFLTRLLHSARADLPPVAVRAFEQTLIVLADHELNVSTLAARAVASTQGDLHAAIVAALAALTGPLHGGALVGVATLLERLPDPPAAERLAQARLAAGGLPGFGHPIYPHGDPRAPVLRSTAATIRNIDRSRWEAVETLVAAVQRGGGPPPNADLYAGLIYQLLGFPADLFAPLFATARLVGWIAHYLEQRAQDRPLRPRARYTGAPARTWDAPATRPSPPAVAAARDANDFWICGSD